MQCIVHMGLTIRLLRYVRNKDYLLIVNVCRPVVT